MVIKLLAFGIAKDIMGGAVVDITIAVDQPTVYDLRQELEQCYPALKQLKSYMIALNNEYTTDKQSISAADEIAIIPPVSGG